MKLLLRWLASAAALLLVAVFVPGVVVDGFGTALLASLVIGLINATLGALVRLLTFPVRWLTLGLFTLVINAAMFALATAVVDGFRIEEAWAALVGALAYGLLAAVIQRILGVRKR